MLRLPAGTIVVTSGATVLSSGATVLSSGDSVEATVEVREESPLISTSLTK